MEKLENYMIKKEINMVVAVILGILLFGLAIGFSWISVCGIVKLITLCFGWTFSWPIATGVWLILLLLGMVFK